MKWKTLGSKRLWAQEWIAFLYWITDWITIICTYWCQVNNAGYSWYDIFAGRVLDWFDARVNDRVCECLYISHCQQPGRAQCMYVWQSVFVRDNGQTSDNFSGFCLEWMHTNPQCWCREVEDTLWVLWQAFVDIYVSGGWGCERVGVGVNVCVSSGR